MKDELTKLLAAERKHKRQLDELRKMREKVARQTQPDQKVLKMIDEEIASLLK